LAVGFLAKRLRPVASSRLATAMEPARARFEAREIVLAGRLERAERVRFTGLWAAGSLAGLARPTVAVVGSRAPSDGGRSRAWGLAAALARAGVCVISRLALGIDAAAHSGALEGGGPTIGVLGGGHGCFFPRRNAALAEAMIANGGAVLSPYAPEHPALPAQFLQRNGIVAALADIVVIVEAAERSGALNTAGWAAALGIDVLAFPGDVDRPKAAGCNALIRDGATLVRDAHDVLAGLGLHAVAPEATLSQPHRNPLERCVLEALAAEPRDLDMLLESTGGPVPQLLAALARLEIDGSIERRAASAAYALRQR